MNNSRTYQYNYIGISLFALTMGTSRGHQNSTNKYGKKWCASKWTCPRLKVLTSSPLYLGVVPVKYCSCLHVHPTPKKVVVGYRIPQITINRWYKPFPHGWFMTLFYPHYGYRYWSIAFQSTWITPPDACLPTKIPWRDLQSPWLQRFHNRIPSGNHFFFLFGQHWSYDVIWKHGNYNSGYLVYGFGWGSCFVPRWVSTQLRYSLSPFKNKMFADTDLN